MPDPRTIVVPIEGKDVTVPLPEGWMHEDEVKEEWMPKDQFSKELDRRVKGVTKGLVKPSDLLEDEEFLKRILGVDVNKERAYEVLGMKPGDPPKDVDIAELRGKIEAEVVERLTEAEIKPREEELGLAKALNEKLRERDFKAMFIKAGLDVGLHGEMTEPISSFYRTKFKFSEDDDGWFKIGDDGEYEINIKPEPGGPRYRTILNVLEEERRGGNHKTWFEAPAAGGGAGYQGAGSGRKLKVTFEEFKAMNQAKRREIYDGDPELFKHMLKLLEEEGSQALSG